MNIASQKNFIDFYLSYFEFRDRESLDAVFNFFDLWVYENFEFIQKVNRTKLDEMEVGDLCQIVLIRIFKNIESLKFETEGQARSYVSTACRHLFIDTVRRKGNEKFMSMEELEMRKFKSFIPTVNQEVFSQIEFIQPFFDLAFCNLSGDHDKIIKLLMLGYPHEEIASILNDQNLYNKNAFKQKIYRARVAFKKELKGVLSNVLKDKGMDSGDSEIIGNFLKKIR